MHWARPSALAPRESGPTLLTIPALGLRSRPIAVGSQTDGALDLAPGARSISWWAQGAGAGEATGTLLLAGHVTWDGRRGTMYELDDIPVGARLSIRRADGRRVAYRVVDVRRIHRTSLAKLGIDAGRRTHRLLLVTCGGPYDPETHSYRDNIVVTAHPVTA